MKNATRINQTEKAIMSEMFETSLYEMIDGSYIKAISLKDLAAEIIEGTEDAHNAGKHWKRHRCSDYRARPAMARDRAAMVAIRMTIKANRVRKAVAEIKR